MDSTAVFAIITLITSLGYFVMTSGSPSIKSSHNKITSGGKYTRRVGRGNRKTRK